MGEDARGDSVPLRGEGGFDPPDADAPAASPPPTIIAEASGGAAYADELGEMTSSIPTPLPTGEIAETPWSNGDDVDEDADDEELGGAAARVRLVGGETLSPGHRPFSSAISATSTGSCIDVDEAVAMPVV